MVNAESGWKRRPIDTDSGGSLVWLFGPGIVTSENTQAKAALTCQKKRPGVAPGQNLGIGKVKNAQNMNFRAN